MGRQFTQQFQAIFKKAKQKFYALTGIKWVKKGVYDCDYIKIDDGKNGCFSNVGKIGGEQILNLCKISGSEFHT